MDQDRAQADSPPRPASLLTERERQCVLAARGGRSAKEIGRTLGISDATVETHLKRARQKLGVTRTVQAIAALDDQSSGTTNSWVYQPVPLAGASDAFEMGPSETSGDAPILHEHQAPFEAFDVSPGRGSDDLRTSNQDGFLRGLALWHHIGLAVLTVFLIMLAIIGSASFLETLTKLHREYRLHHP